MWKLLPQPKPGTWRSGAPRPARWMPASGSLEIEGADKQIPVVFQGRILYLPAALSLQAGKYEVRSVLDGKVVSAQQVEIQAGSPQKVTVRR